MSFYGLLEETVFKVGQRLLAVISPSSLVQIGEVKDPYCSGASNGLRPARRTVATPKVEA